MNHMNKTMFLAKSNFTNLFVLCFLIVFSLSCKKEETCLDNISEEKAAALNYCENELFTNDTLRINLLTLEKDSIKEKLSTLELGLKLSGSFIFEKPNFRFLIYAQFSEKFDSLTIVEDISGTFMDEVDFLGYTSTFCLPKKRGKLILDSELPSDHLGVDLAYDFSCNSKTMVLKQVINDLEYSFSCEIL